MDANEGGPIRSTAADLAFSTVSDKYRMGQNATPSRVKSRRKREDGCHSLPMSSISSRGRGIFFQKGGYSSHTSRAERNALAAALQKNIVPLVETLPFSESELPDLLIGDDCLTETECSSIRHLPDKKDQVRQLIILLKGRSFEVLERFLQHARSFNGAVVQEIWRAYEQAIQNGGFSKRCVICRLTEDVYVKYVADKLWSTSTIKGYVFQDITRCDRPAGDQDSLWKKVIEACCNISDVESLCQALRYKGHYTHLSDAIQTQFENHGCTLACTCAVSLIEDRRPKRQRQMSTDSSHEPASSVSDSEIHSNDGGTEVALEPEMGIDVVNEPEIEPTFPRNAFVPNTCATPRQARGGNPASSNQRRTGILSRIFMCVPSRLNPPVDEDW